MLPAPARSLRAPAGPEGEGSQAQPAPSGSRDLRSAAAGPRDKLSPEAGRRGRGGAAYRVRRAGRQAAARPTAASWCRRSRRRSLPPGGPAGSRGTRGGGSPRGSVPVHRGGRAPQVAPRSLPPPVLPESKPLRQGTGRGCPRPGNPAPRAAAPATATATAPGPAPSRPGPFPPSAPAPGSPDPTRRRLPRGPRSSSGRPHIPSLRESPLPIPFTTARMSLTLRNYPSGHSRIPIALALGQRSARADLLGSLLGVTPGPAAGPTSRLY